MKLLVWRTRTVIGARDRSTAKFTGCFKIAFLLDSDICAETDNFLRQHNDAAHLRIIYFALYKCTHRYHYHYAVINF